MPLKFAVRTVQEVHRTADANGGGAMPLDIYHLKTVPLDADSFAPFGDVLEPRGRRLDNLDLLELGYARMSDAVPQERLADFDVLDYWGDIAAISSDSMRLGYMRSKARRPLSCVLV